MGCYTCILTIRTHNSSMSPFIYQFGVAGLEFDGFVSQTPSTVDPTANRIRSTAEMEGIQLMSIDYDAPASCASLMRAAPLPLESPLPTDGFFCLSLEPARCLSLPHLPSLGVQCAPRLRAARVSSLSALVGIETRTVASSPLHPGHLGGLRDAYEAWSSQVSPAGAPARMSSVCQA
jgi:hypothetical protein